MAIRTWEVKLLAGNNGVVQMNVEADDWEENDVGIRFYKGKPDDEDRVYVAFFPMAPLLSVKDVTP